MIDGVQVPFTAEEEAAQDAKEAEWTAYQAANGYKASREYPSITDQLDMQYHDSVNGTTTWADTIAAVKAAHPKA